MKEQDIKPGCLVAFNKLESAIWFTVIAREGHSIVVREHGTNYAPQDADVCMVRQIKEPS